MHAAQSGQPPVRAPTQAQSTLPASQPPAGPCPPSQVPPQSRQGGLAGVPLPGATGAACQGRSAGGRNNGNEGGHSGHAPAWPTLHDALPGIPPAAGAWHEEVKGAPQPGLSRLTAIPLARANFSSPVVMFEVDYRRERVGRRPARGPLQWSITATCSHDVPLPGSSSGDSFVYYRQAARPV